MWAAAVHRLEVARVATDPGAGLAPVLRYLQDDRIERATLGAEGRSRHAPAGSAAADAARLAAVSPESALERAVEGIADAAFGALMRAFAAQGRTPLRARWLEAHARTLLAHCCHRAARVRRAARRCSQRVRRTPQSALKRALPVTAQTWI